MAQSSRPISFASDNVLLGASQEVSKEHKQMMSYRLIQQCGVDYQSRPIIVVSACNLPNPQEVSYDHLLQFMTTQLDPFVESDYVIVFFYSGMKYRPSWTWIKEAYSVLDRKYKKNLKNIYVVHPSIWHKLFMRIIEVFVSNKVIQKIVYIQQLADLNKHLPLHQLDIPEVVRSLDPQFKRGIPSSNPAQAVTAEHPQFGVALTATELDEAGLPKVLSQLIDHIRANGLTVEGIFRRSPSSVLLQLVKTKFNQGEPVKLAEYEIHVAAVLLKMFFRDLPTPIFPENLHDTIIAIQALSTGEERMEATRQLLADLPPANRLSLAALMGLLRDIAARSDVNMMTSANLAIVFSPNLFSFSIVTQNQGAGVAIVRRMVDNYSDVFEPQQS